ncbi:hypothetical protein C8J56DRAFT_1024270 [Mycena floridula]|nr:hypothetical protein C8J56DRAFT_1024270 [Mycena floridula]
MSTAARKSAPLEPAHACASRRHGGLEKLAPSHVTRHTSDQRDHRPFSGCFSPSWWFPTFAVNHDDESQSPRNEMFDDLIKRANLGDLDALKTIHDRLGYREAELYRRALPDIVYLLGQDRPILACTPLPKEVEVPILCFSILHRSLTQVTQNMAIGPLDTDLCFAGAQVVQYICEDWSNICGWMEYFLKCLDVHREQRPSGQHSMYQAMVSDSAGLLARMAMVSMSYANGEAGAKFLGSVPGYIGLLVGFTLRPAQELRTEQNFGDAVIPLSTFDGRGARIAITEEFITQLALESPAAVANFQDQMVQRSKCLTEGENDGAFLQGYISVLFFLSIYKPWSVDPIPIRRNLIKGGMVGSITATMVNISTSPPPPHYRYGILVRCLVQCVTYLLHSIRDEGKVATLDALKGSSSIFHSLANAAKVLSQDTEASAQLAELYTQLLHEFTIALVHPAVMHRCLRSLRKHRLLLTTKETRLQPLVDAGKTFLQALSRWKLRRTAYNQLDHPLCGNLQCPHTGVKPKSLKYCTGCLTMVYCSASCQKSHWALHGVECHSLALIRQQDRDIAYLRWVIRLDAMPRFDELTHTDHVLKMDYSGLQIASTLTSVPNFLARTLPFEERDPAVEEIIESGAKTGPFIYALVLNGRFYSFPIVMSKD